jgi:Protein of unknown function DUF262
MAKVPQPASAWAFAVGLSILTLRVRFDQGPQPLRRTVRLFFEPRQFHLEPADLLEQLGLLGLGVTGAGPDPVAQDLIGPGEQLLLLAVNQGRVDPVLAGHLVDGPVSLEGSRATWALNAVVCCLRLPAIVTPFLRHHCSLAGGPVFGVHYSGSTGGAGQFVRLLALRELQGMTILSLLGQIANKEIVLPAIQRDFVWDEAKTEKLLESVLCGYPIGLTLLWETYEDLQYRTFDQDFGSSRIPVGKFYSFGSMQVRILRQR